jgi:hypothetical protein
VVIAATPVALGERGVADDRRRRIAGNVRKTPMKKSAIRGFSPSRAQRATYV